MEGFGPLKPRQQTRIMRTVLIPTSVCLKDKMSDDYRTSSYCLEQNDRKRFFVVAKKGGHKMKETVKREILIDKLIQYGIFKINNQQLFELSLKELEKAYKKVQQ